MLRCKGHLMVMAACNNGRSIATGPLFADAVAHRTTTFLTGRRPGNNMGGVEVVHLGGFGLATIV